MSKVLSSLAIVAVAFSANAALACKGDSARFHDVALSSDGVVSRFVMVKKPSDAQKANASEKMESVVRDRVKLEKGDELTLNSGLRVVDAAFHVTVKAIDQSRDARGVFFTTYEVTEAMTSNFAGQGVVTTKKFNTKVISNYSGNGVYARSCGHVEQMEIAPPADGEKRQNSFETAPQ